jgi:hypothetical protein
LRHQNNNEASSQCLQGPNVLYEYRPDLRKKGIYIAFRKTAQFKEVSLEYVSASGASTFRFFTDMPGGHLADRTGVAGKPLPQTNPDRTPATVTIPLIDANGAPLEGTLFYPRVEPFATSASGGTQLRSGVVWLRTIGVYLDGALNEFWETLPQSIGV